MIIYIRGDIVIFKINYNGNVKKINYINKQFIIWGVIYV